MSTSVKKLEKWPRKIMAMAQKRLQKEVFMAGQWQTTWSNLNEFQVHHHYNGQGFIVDIYKINMYL
jgi:hypothetical protein